MRDIKHQGFSLVELMVAMAIGLLILSGVILTLMNSKRSFEDQSEMAFVQENSRFAIDLISRDIRMAGFMGCAIYGSADIANSINDSTGGLISTLAIEGFEGKTPAAGFPAFINSPADGTDALIVRHASPEEKVVRVHNLGMSRFVVSGPTTYEAGSTLMVVDANCRQVGLFQASSVANTNSNRIFHLAGATPGNNCTKNLKGSFDCSNTVGSSNLKYSDNSSIMEYESTAYFVGDSNILPGMPALKREIVSIGAGSVSTKEEELVSGVEDMQILYGVDVSLDGEIDRYVNADDMDLNASGAINAADWDLVKAVRISLTFRSQRANDPITQTISTTVQLRNRG